MDLTVTFKKNNKTETYSNVSLIKLSKNEPIASINYGNDEKNEFDDFLFRSDYDINITHSNGVCSIARNTLSSMSMSKLNSKDI